jgi:Flp pilus assembly protein TadG
VFQGTTRFQGATRSQARTRFGGRRAARGAGERGTALVETAIILPLIILLVFGIVEFSSAFHDSSITADAARAGGRIASAQARNPDYATNAGEAVAAALKTLPANAPQQLWVYRANAQGFPGTETDFSSCGAKCIEYTWNSSTQDWNYDTPTGGGWDASLHQVCNEPFDEIGIYLTIRHDFVTRFFGASVDLDDHSVFRFEPTPSAVCAST